VFDRETMLSDKKIIIIGDKDGVPGPAIEACVKSAGAEVVFSSTKCFACSAVGGIDFEMQQIVKDYASKYGAQNIVVVIGGAEAEASGLCAETVTVGDPTLTGPLAGIALGLVVYHIVEPEIKDICEKSIYEEQCGVMEMILEINEIIVEVKSVRDKFSRYDSK
jgi:glycine/sarcosine/betaine reductase complex component A